MMYDVWSFPEMGVPQNIQVIRPFEYWNPMFFADPQF